MMVQNPLVDNYLPQKRVNDTGFAVFNSVLNPFLNVKRFSAAPITSLVNPKEIRNIIFGLWKREMMDTINQSIGSYKQEEYWLEMDKPQTSVFSVLGLVISVEVGFLECTILKAVES